MAAAAAAAAAASQDKSEANGRPPRLAPWKALAVTASMVLLTPVLAVYGLVGWIMTLPSSSVTELGLNFLAALVMWISLQVFLVVDPAWVEEEEEKAFEMWKKWALAASFVALLFAQYALDELLVFCTNRKREDRRVDYTRLASFLLPVAAVAFLWRWSIEALSRWQLIPSTSLCAFVVLYLALPVLVALAQIQAWIPARYSELERLERAILERNVKVPFHMMKPAGLGTVHIPCTAPDDGEPSKTLVLVHGYAAGNALWACNVEELAKQYDVYAVEWLGTGRSNRPEFKSYELEDADSVFVEAFEDWRKELQLEKFYLGGHSLGALLCSSYALKYPEHVEHLALISPVGVGRAPAPGPLPLGLRVFRFLWKLRLTPMSVARFAGPLGPALVRFITSARVGRMPESSCVRRGLIPLDSLAAYWYHNWALEKSGEIAMHSHLLPGAFAKRPLCEMLTPETIQIPITFLYGGGSDWMSSSHGDKLAEAFAGKQSVEVLLVPGAGHQVFMDNASAFNQLLLGALARV